MAGEFTSDRDAMAAELAWLEGLLADVEDWRALQQLEAREAKGEGITSIDGPRLKASLYAGLSGSRFFKRREAVIAEMARAAKDAAYGPPLAINPVPGSSPEAHDDLRLIRGVSAVLVRRLAALDVRTFNQISAWSSADVQYVAKILDLGRAISSQNWIEQAALLARARAAPVAAVLVPVPTGRAQTAPAAPAVAPVLATVLEFVPAEPEKLDRPDTAALVPAGPLPAWRYSLDQKSPMNIADALAALSQLHKSVLDDAVAEDRAGVHVATPEPSFNHPGVVALPRPAVPLPASSYRALHPVLPEMALPLPAIDVQPDPVVEPQSRNDEVLPWPAMPPPAVQYALGEVTGPVLPPEEVNLPPPPVPASASGSPIPVPTPVATAPRSAGSFAWPETTAIRRGTRLSTSNPGPLDRAFSGMSS